MEKIRFGVFGLSRGQAFVHIINTFREEAALTAVCDNNPARLEEVKKICAEEGAPDVKLFDSFEPFIDSGLDVVVLCNCFHQHTPFAIAAMKKGVHVISECTSGGTLKECVELVRCVEETGCKYMIAENYPFTPERLDMANLARSGKLGKILYSEGEYNHPGTVEEMRGMTPGLYHWRAWIPRTYYLTHAIGPLMYMTDTMPLTINARAAYSPDIEAMKPVRNNYDGVAMMFCQMSDGSIARFTGSSELASPNGYRVCGDRGSTETGRTVPAGKVYTHFNSWEIPEGMEQDSTYAPEMDEVMKRAEGYGHGGGDYHIIYNMVQALLHDTPFFFDVYKGAAMSAVGILAWRSILHDGATYHIPDFTKEEDRRAVENDDLTPFPDENGNGITLPCSSHEAREKGYRIY